MVLSFKTGLLLHFTQKAISPEICLQNFLLGVMSLLINHALTLLNEMAIRVTWEQGYLCRN